MIDYKELERALRFCDGPLEDCHKCQRFGTEACHTIFRDAADAIGELLSAVLERDNRIKKFVSRELAPDPRR